MGIALAGGGPLGAIYEIGALVALEKALKGLTLTDLDVYVGVSSGAFLAAGLANGIAPSEMHAMFILDRSHHDPFEPEILLRPAFGEFAQRLMGMPELMQAAAFAYFGALPTRGLVESFMRLTRGLPNGLFDNGAFAAYLARRFSEPGRTDDFRKLAHKLFIVATDLDSGKSVPFGAPGLDHVPISEAIKASSALPGLYPPARIGDRDYVDGALKKTLHASVALKEGVKLLICVNPLVPYDADRAARRRREAGASGRPRPPDRSVPDLPRPHPFAHEGRHGALRQGIPGRRRRAVRAGAGRRGDLLRQHVQLCRPPQAGRARLSPYAFGVETAGARTRAYPRPPRRRTRSAALQGEEGCRQA